MPKPGLHVFPKTIALALFFAAFMTFEALAQNTPCPLDARTLRFTGTPVEQARCLLRPNRIGGVLGAPLRKLPAPLEKLIGRRVEFSRESLRRYLTANKLDERDLGGSLEEPLSAARLPDGTTERALYFVIHDTSSPYTKENKFPVGIDTDPDWSGNRTRTWSKLSVAHIFVTRLGESVTTRPFDSPLVENAFGTKLARRTLKDAAKGLQLHIELVQPRRYDPAFPQSPKNDRIAPVPGFTARQYERLALLYAAASVRRGEWLVPGYHAAFDAGIPDAHDDPQNFELKKFAAALERLLGQLK